PNGQPFGYVEYDNIGPQFASNLGFVPEVNLRNLGAGAEQFNRFEKGPLETYDVGVDMNAAQFYTGGFFHNLVSPYFYLSNRGGWLVGSNPNFGQREKFHDHTNDL